VDDPGLGRFIEGGGNRSQGFGSILFLACAEQLQVVALEAPELRLTTAILNPLAGTVPHPAFG